MNRILATKALFVLFLCFSIAFMAMDINMGVIHSVVTFAMYICFIVVFKFWFNQRQHITYPKLYKGFLLLFTVYSIAILFDLTIDRQFPLSEMLGCPSTVQEFILNSGILFFILLFVPLLNNIRNFDFLYYWFIGLNSLSMIYIVMHVGSGGLGGLALTLSCTATSVILLSFALLKSSENTTHNKAFLIFAIIAGIIVWGFCSKRGPILYFMVILLFWYASGNKGRSVKTLFTLTVLVGLLVIFQDFVLNTLGAFAPELASKFRETVQYGDTSGRIGDDSSGYALAISQIQEGPWLGSYFRLTVPYGIWSGMYPHNFFLELLMTFGLLGTVFSLFFIVKAVLYSNKIFQMQGKTSMRVRNLFFTILFLNSFLSMMSTGTPLLNRTFWVSFGLILYFSSLKPQTNV